MSLNYLWCEIFLETCIWNEVNWCNLVVNYDYVLVLYMLDKWSDYVLVLYMLDELSDYVLLCTWLMNDLSVRIFILAWLVAMYYICSWWMNPVICLNLIWAWDLKDCNCWPYHWNALPVLPVLKVVGYKAPCYFLIAVKLLDNYKLRVTPAW